MAAIAKRAPRVRGVAAFVVAYPLAQDLLDFLLGCRRGCYGRRRCRRGPASLGALLRYERRAPACAWRWSTPAARALRRAPARLRLRRLTPAWRWGSPATRSVLVARARWCTLATPRPRARTPPVASPIVTRATAV